MEVLSIQDAALSSGLSGEDPPPLTIHNDRAKRELGRQPRPRQINDHQHRR